MINGALSMWQRPVVFHINGYGDRLLALPAIRALAQIFGRSLRVLCARGDVAMFLSGIPATTIEIDAQRMEGGWTFDADRVAEAIGECDLFLSLNTHHGRATDRLLQALAPRHSIGFFDAFSQRLPRRTDLHAIDEAFQVPRIFDPSLSPAEFNGVPAFGAAAERDAAEIAHHIPPQQRILAVHTETVPEKSWPASDFVAVLDQFLGQRGDFIALIVDRAGEGMEDGIQSAGVIPCYRLPLPTAMAIVARATLFLGVDSCMLHVADMARVPGVALFRATSAARFGYRFAPGISVEPGRPLTGTAAREIATSLADLADAHVGPARPQL